MKKYITILTLLFCFFVFNKTANADVEINYQAKLTDSNGKIVENGNYHMKFKIWQTQNADNILWTETLSGENRIKIENGIFQVKLGKINPINFNFSNDDYYLSIVVGGKGENPNWDLGISLIKKIKLSDLKFKMQTLGIDVFEKEDNIAENTGQDVVIKKSDKNRPIKTKDLMNAVEGQWVFQGNALTDFLLQSLSAPENALNLFDLNKDVVLTTAQDRNFKIILGSSKSSVDILTGNLKIGLKNPESLPGFKLKGESVFVSGDLGIAGKTYLGNELFLQGKNIAAKMYIINLEAEAGDVVVAITDDNNTNQNSTTTKAQLSYQPNDKNILGVISENPGILLNHNADNNNKPVALNGIVKIKVCNENGIIKKGDLLTTSSIKGRAMKVELSGASIVAKALENFDQEQALSDSKHPTGQGVIDAMLQLGVYYTNANQILTVAKKGGNFTSISSAMDSIQDASEKLPYLIKVDPGIYEENIIMKQYVDIVGAGPSLVKITSKKLPIVKMASNSRLQGTSIQLSIINNQLLNKSKIQNLKLEIGIVEVNEEVENVEINLVKIIVNDELGIMNDELRMKNEKIENPKSEIRNLKSEIVGVLVGTSSSAEIYNVDISGVDRGVVKIGKGTANITHSTIRANESDLQTIEEELRITNYELRIKNEEEIVNRQSSIVNSIVSSYNFLLGTGYNFNIATNTAVSSFADKYATVNKKGSFVVLDHAKDSKESAFTVQQKGAGDILNLQNFNTNVFTVKSDGAVNVVAQNATGTSFNIFSQSNDVGMQISQNGSGPSARFLGEVIISPKFNEEIARLTFDSNSVISAKGNTISIGGEGDTVKLNVPGTKYEFSEKTRRNTIFLFVDKPRSNQYLLGNKNNSWQPEEDIIILKLKLQYSVANTDDRNTIVNSVDNNVLQVVLYDNAENTIIDTGLVFQNNLGYYQVVTDVFDKKKPIKISSDQGIYLAITHAQGVEQLSIEIEYLYE